MFSASNLARDLNRSSSQVGIAHIAGSMITLSAYRQSGRGFDRPQSVFEQKCLERAPRTYGWKHCDNSDSCWTVSSILSGLSFDYGQMGKCLRNRLPIGWSGLSARPKPRPRSLRAPGLSPRDDRRLNPCVTARTCAQVTLSWCHNGNSREIDGLQLSNQNLGWVAARYALTVVKTGGRLAKHARYYWLLLGEGHLARKFLVGVLGKIAVLPSPAG